MPEAMELGMTLRAGPTARCTKGQKASAGAWYTTGTALNTEPLKYLYVFSLVATPKSFFNQCVRLHGTLFWREKGSGSVAQLKEKGTMSSTSPQALQLHSGVVAIPPLTDLRCLVLSVLRKEMFHTPRTLLFSSGYYSL